MSFTTTHSVDHYFTLDSGEVIDLPFEAADWIDPFISDDGRKFVYAARDPESGMHWFKWGDIEFEEFRAEWDRDAWIESREGPMMDVYIVGKYEHSGVSYCVHGERTYPDMQWDYAPCAAIALPKGDNGYTDTLAAAKAWMDEYTAWCNGDVYGVIVMERDDTGEWSEVDAVWGCIGTEYAQSLVNQGGY